LIPLRGGLVKLGRDLWLYWCSVRLARGLTAACKASPKPRVSLPKVWKPALLDPAPIHLGLAPPNCGNTSSRNYTLFERLYIKKNFQVHKYELWRANGVMTLLYIGGADYTHCAVHIFTVGSTTQGAWLERPQQVSGQSDSDPWRTWQVL
jgi:hypothetical protein